MSVFLLNDIFALLIFGKNISKTISNLVSAIKIFFWKNLDLPALFSTFKSAITISKIFKVEPSIFWATTLVFWYKNLASRQKRDL